VGNYYGGVRENNIRIAFSTTAYKTTGTVVGPDLPTADTPTNDNFNARKTLSGPKLSVFGINTGATRESFEPSGTRYRTLWYSWGTNQAGKVTVTIGGVGFSDQTLGVYSGSDIAALKNIALTHVSGSASYYTFTAEANVTYHISLGSYYNENYGLVSFDLAGPGAGASAGSGGPIVSRFANVSTRALVAANGNLNPGFVVTGDTKKTVLIRGVGPGLAQFGVSGTMPDPILTVFSGAATIGSNDNWSATVATATALRAAFAATGAFGFTDGSRDAALLLTLDPGAYTVTLRDVGGTAGDAIVEIYEVP
jgi:hypothetical protein